MEILPAPSKFSVPLDVPPAWQAQLQPGHQFYTRFVTLASPQDWPERLEGGTHRQPLNLGALALGLACYGLWGFAIAPRPWYRRHGMRRALAICLGRMGRSLRSSFYLSLLLGGAAGITLIWGIGGARWAALLSALVGMAVSGGLVWVVRILGAVTLRKEAMGFGDVLLMMMIGTFVGWQAGLFIFFLAPLAGLVVGVLQYLWFRDHAIPYGPFLSLAALTTIVWWPRLWSQAEPFLAIPWLVPTVLAIGFAAMALMLLALQSLRSLLSRAF